MLHSLRLSSTADSREKPSNVPGGQVWITDVVACLPYVVHIDRSSLSEVWKDRPRTADRYGEPSRTQSVEATFQEREGSRHIDPLRQGDP